MAKCIGIAGDFQNEKAINRRLMFLLAVFLLAGLSSATASTAMTNEPIVSQPDSGVIIMGGKTLSVADVNPLAGTQTLSRVLQRIDPIAAEYKGTTTTAQKDVVTQKIVAEFKKQVDGKPLRTSAILRDVKVIDDNTAELHVSDLEYDDYARQCKPSLYCIIAPYGLRIAIPKKEALAVKGNSKVVLLGQAAFSSGGSLPLFPKPNSKTPFTFVPSSCYLPFVGFGTVSFSDPEIRISSAIYRLK
jgi:hypothetical protein